MSRCPISTLSLSAISRKITIHHGSNWPSDPLTRPARVRCKICDSSTEVFQRGSDLGKYEADYFRCPMCGFIQTEEPHWLSEAYEAPINRSDVGYLMRNITYSKITSALLSSCFDPGRPCVDYGGGYGVFVRLMRDRGYDFYRYDKYCPNLFAPDFEVREGTVGFELLTAFEVFEHLVEPRAELEAMLTFSENILF